MSGTAEENTRYIEVWILNDEPYYEHARVLACVGATDELRKFIVRSLRQAPPETGAWYTNREMSDADFDLVDWREVSDTLADRTADDESGSDFVWNSHVDDTGNYCPHSGEVVPADEREDEDARCPSGCRASAIED